MNYRINEKQKRRRDWVVILLIWANSIQLLVIFWLWLKCYTGGF